MVYVANLDHSTTDSQLAGVFRDQQLTVQKARLLFDQAGKPKGAGFVEFASSGEAATAVK